MWSQIALVSNIVFEPYWSRHIKDNFEEITSKVKTVAVPYNEFENYLFELKNWMLLWLS